MDWIPYFWTSKSDIKQTLICSCFWNVIGLFCNRSGGIHVQWFEIHPFDNCVIWPGTLALVSQSPCLIYWWERGSKTKKYAWRNYRKGVLEYGQIYMPYFPSYQCCRCRPTVRCPFNLSKFEFNKFFVKVQYFTFQSKLLMIAIKTQFYWTTF